MAAISLLLFICCLHLTAAQTIYIDPLELEVLEGGKINLVCIVTNYKDSHVLQWHRIDGQLSEQERTTVTLFEGNGQINLDITSVQIQDAGMYFCSVFDKEQKTLAVSLSSKVTVLFHTLELYPLCAFSQYLNELTIGTPVLLRCQYPVRDQKNGTSLVWEKGDQEKVHGRQWQNFNEADKMVYSYLNFTAHEDLHDTVFTCTYHNESRRQEASVCHIGPIGVHFAPKVEVYPSEINVKPGEEVGFNCSGKAQPVNITYTWYLSPKTQDITTRLLNNGQMLRLTDILSTLSGKEFKVTCEASNSVGIGISEASLHIKETESSESISFSSTLVIFPVIIAVTTVCFIFLIIFIICYVSSKRTSGNSEQETYANPIVELHNSERSNVPRVEENAYAIVDEGGLVVKLSTEPDGAYAIKAGEFVQDDVELIKK